MEVMKAAGAPLSPLVSRWKARDDGDGGVLEQSIRVFFKVGRIAVSKVNGETRYRIRDGQRLPLDYYKNNTIHFLAPLALVAATLRHLPNQRASEAEIRREVALGCTLYQWEFMFCDCLLAGEGENGGAVARLVDRAVSILVELGLLAMEGDEVRVVDASANDFLADILRNFHEVYLAAVQGAMTRFLNGGQDPASKIAQSLTEKLLASKTFLKPEGHSELNRKSAMNTLKELKLTRPAKGEDPFRNGEMGDALYKYLKAVTGVG
jgi:glycerol-3-phosphate O-acyltransferase